MQMLDVRVRMYLYRWSRSSASRANLADPSEPFEMQVRSFSTSALLNPKDYGLGVLMHDMFNCLPVSHAHFMVSNLSITPASSHSQRFTVGAAPSL